MSPSQLSLRQAAWEVLNHFNAAERNCAELIEKFGAKTQNRSGLVDITLGIIRNYAFVDSLITQVSIQPKNNIPTETFNCLRIAVYELVFSNRAHYAVVNETVNLARKIGSKKSAGFVNAVLRKTCAHIKNKNANLKIAEPQKTLPLNSRIGCEFDIDILPDPDRNKAEYLSSAFSLPLWLIEQWLAQFGPEKTTNICFASNRRPSIYARANKLKLTGQELFEILKAQDINCDFVDFGELSRAEKYKMVRLNKPGNISELNVFKEGLFTIQDITSSSVVPLLNPLPGWKIFDICAAPGTKTTQIAELIHNKGLIIATDKDNARLAKLEENIQRLGITSVRIIDYETFLKDLSAKADSSYQSSGDAVLLDVPCSNSGVLARRPEVRLRITLKKINELAQTQKQLLNLAASLVKSGGRICYSTCSILQQENNDVVNAFIKQHSQFSLEKENLVLPSAGTYDFDGGYTAIIVKK
jgi:16S rRNA (cytosine967-C5)-methyltransferase